MRTLLKTLCATLEYLFSLDCHIWPSSFIQWGIPFYWNTLSYFTNQQLLSSTSSPVYSHHLSNNRPFKVISNAKEEKIKSLLNDYKSGLSCMSSICLLYDALRRCMAWHSQSCCTSFGMSVSVCDLRLGYLQLGLLVRASFLLIFSERLQLAMRRNVVKWSSQ